MKSAERAIAVLEYLSAAGEPRSLREVHGDLAIPRASAYALLVTLVHSGWVEPDATGSRYRLGIRALRVGASYVEQDDVVQRAQRVMDEMSQEWGETVHLARLDGQEIVYLATCISRHSLAVVSRPGRRLPCWATGLGKALLAERPWAEVDALLPETLAASTVNTFTDRQALRAELRRVKERGHSVDEQESTIGLRCFAVTLNVKAGAVPNEALSFSVPVVRLDAERERRIVAALLDARDRIVR
ncbi:IclR family transcriptional regulator [Streptomonospora wellingtoniae]|uniref:IclR family transcriptional regulator n=1 Tax=Streptomonospora wellingtoniae TaxID=3075544 RepID=A0ABU2KYX4_9ACTN|nr:IclR family transcriptional regulator [Streptomonospora sp. DSM 45055]MDT0304510.1 IclR family transcriptional regulator [Streptomonospora sp. DSM 45055]